MKARKSIRVESSEVSGILNTGTINSISIRQTGRSKRPMAYPVGSIGSNLLQRNYVHYLVKRYNDFREADSSFGRFTGKYSYAANFKIIERKFKERTYFIRESRFHELVAFLQARLDNTILGKRNRARGIRNYATFEEFSVERGDEASPRP